MSVSLKDSFLSLKNDIQRLSITEVLEKLYEAFPGRIVFSTSFSFEDQVITDFISKAAPVSIFTLDTGLTALVQGAHPILTNPLSCREL